MEIPGYLRVEHMHRFENVRRRANWMRIWHRLTGSPETLLPFGPVYDHLKSRVVRQGGLREIPLRQIVGSLDKASRFDRSFRPRSDKLRARWLNVKMLHLWGGWEPVVLHKVGNLYFVEDGHHRVSVARDAGLEVIESEVIEYACELRFNLNASLQTILQMLDADRTAANANGTYGVVYSASSPQV
jgi:hypothetical protein